jgi:diguanylate cyclase (GGDEF)-like protein
MVTLNDESSILIADDTPENLTVLRKMLTEQGYRVRPAISGKIALKAVDEELPDLILLDIMMPEMDGYEVCRHLKANKRTRDIPVLFISALDETINKVEAFAEGGLDYITKPFHLEEVLARVQTHLMLRYMQVKLQEQNIQLKQEIEERKKAQADLADANKKLEDLANFDGLTQIPNRRYFNEFFELEWKRLVREKRMISVLLMDIDFFKRFNDTYGHVAGDECLKKVAQGIAKCIKRPADMAARYGGEEFVVLLPMTDHKGAIQVAELIQTKISDLKILNEKSDAGPFVSLSIGVACKIPDTKKTPQDLIHEADQALYQAKESGRNQIKLST